MSLGTLTNYSITAVQTLSTDKDCEVRLLREPWGTFLFVFVPITHLSCMSKQTGLLQYCITPNALLNTFLFLFPGTVFGLGCFFVFFLFFLLFLFFFPTLLPINSNPYIDKQATRCYPNSTETIKTRCCWSNAWHWPGSRN